MLLNAHDLHHHVALPTLSQLAYAAWLRTDLCQVQATDEAQLLYSFWIDEHLAVWTFM